MHITAVLAREISKCKLGQFFADVFQVITIPNESRLLESISIGHDPVNVFEKNLVYGGYALSFLGTKCLVAPFDRWRVLRQVFPARVLGWRDILLRGWTGVIPHVSHALMFTSLHLGGLSLLDRYDFVFPIFNPIAASILATTLVYPLDVRYTSKVVGVPKPSRYTGFSLGLISVPFSVVGSLSGLSFLSTVFPLPAPDASNIDYCRGVAVGTSGAMMGSLLTYPIDTVRRRMISGMTMETAFQGGKFFSGVSIHILKSIPEYALLSICYLTIKQSSIDYGFT